MRLRGMLLLFSLYTIAIYAEEEELEYELDEGVVILTEKNFDLFLKKNPTALIKFYAPWCGHCKHLAPEYEKASGKVSIPLGKVDATVETDLAKRFDIAGYPTLKFWKDGAGPVDYDGGRDEQGIIDWIMPRIDPNYKPPPEEVVALTVETFDDYIANNPLVLVEFYAPWCGHCKKLAPEYEKAAQRLKNQGYNIKLAKVDATVEKKLGDKFGVSGYPTLKIIRNGRRFEYGGPREASGIVKYMIEQSQPAAKELTDLKAVDKFMDKADVTIIGFFASIDSTSFEAFSDSAEMLREEFKSMGYTSDPAAFKKYDAKPNDIIIFYPSMFQSKFEPRSRTYNKIGATAEDLLAFFREHSAPLVGKMTKVNAATRYSKFPLVVVYYNADFSLQYREGSEYWRQKVLNIAHKYQKDKYRFAVADEEEFAKELEEVGLGDSGLEHNVVVFGYDGKKYPMSPGHPPSLVSSFSSFTALHNHHPSMAATKVYIVYYSTYGHVEKLAEEIKKGAASVEGVEAKLWQVPETLPEDVLGKMGAPPKSDVPIITPNELTEADGLLLGFPTRFGMMASQFKAFLDATGGLWRTQALAGKPAGIFYSTGSQGGGQETTPLTSITQLVHHGMIFVPIGYTFGAGMFEMENVKGGSPYGAGTYAGDGSRQPTDLELAQAFHQGKYFAAIAKKLKGSQ